MAKSKTPMEFLVAFMKRNPKATYADAAAAAKKAKKEIYPIMWGRAQVMLGRKTAKKRKDAKATATPAAKRRGRPPGSKNRPKASSAGVVLPVSSAADLAAWQQLVERLNSGGKVAMSYDGSGWRLVGV